LSFVGQVVKPFFRGTRKKCLLGIGMDKMVTTGRLLLHLQRALELSSQWGPPHSPELLSLLHSQDVNLLILYLFMVALYELFFIQNILFLFIELLF
jgi:hypothetical protein